jgi:hypothetical protein
MTPDRQHQIDDWLESFEQLSGPQLRSQWKRVAREINATFRRFGVKGSLEELHAIIATAENHPDNVYYVRKADLQRLLTKYEEALAVFTKLPPHAFIGVDVNGLIGALSWHLLEAALFEDMAALWNATFELRDQIFPGPPAKVKRASAFQRATLKSAYNLLEGYLNGIAADCLLLYGEMLSSEERSQLLEYDAARDRRQHLSLRQKLLQYPRIAARATDPLFQENSNIEMKGLLGLEDAIRHALIHPDIKVDWPRRAFHAARHESRQGRRRRCNTTHSRYRPASTGRIRRRYCLAHPPRFRRNISR